MLNLQLNDADKRGLSSSMGFAYDEDAYSSSAVAAHLINQNAEVIGIVSRKRYDKEGIAFAIPINDAIEKLKIIQNEK
jgi:S1-C subfamily serine protease